MAKRSHQPQRSNRATQDMYLVQALMAAREMADERGRDGRWGELFDRADRMLGAMGATARGDRIGIPADAMDRIDRTAIQMDAATADRLTSALSALYDQPDDDRLQLVNGVLDDIEGAER